MKTKDAVEKLNNDPGDCKAREALRAKLGHHTALRLDGAGKILLAETLDALEHCEETGEPAPDAITFAEWEAKSAKQREACPVTRKALLNGKLRIERPHGLPAITVDWGPVGTALREVAGYRAETDGFTNPVQAVEALKANPLPLDWAVMQRDWQDLCALKKPTPQQRALIERVRGRLWFEASAQRPIEQPPTFAPILMTKTPVAAPQGDPQTPLMVVLAAPEDAHFVDALRKHCFMLTKMGHLAIWDTSMIRAGNVRSVVIGEQVQRAAIVMHLCSADYLASGQAEMAYGINPSARHVPVLVRFCTLSGVLADKRPLPRNEKPIVKWGEADEAWGDVVQGIRQILRL